MTPGHICNSSCKLEVVIVNPSCTLIPHHPSIVCGNGYTFNYSSANTTTISNIVNIPGNIIPNISSTFTVAPLQDTNYSFTVNGMAGSIPMTCTSNITVNPAQQPDCTFGPNQTIVAGQNVILNYASMNTTSITNQQNIPSWVTIQPQTAYHFNVIPTQTTTYSFTVNGSNPACTTPKTCSTTVTVLPPPPPTCTLTPAQQTINFGESTTLYYGSNNAMSISNLVNISGGIIDPDEIFQFPVSPNQTTIYSFTVNG